MTYTHPSTKKREKKLEALKVSVERMLKEHPEDCEIQEGMPQATLLVKAMAYTYENLWPRGYPIPKDDLKRWVADVRTILVEMKA